VWYFFAFYLITYNVMYSGVRISINLEHKILFATVLFVFAFVMLVVVHMLHGKPEMPTTKWVICWSLSGALKVFELGGDTSYYFKNETNIVNSRELWQLHWAYRFTGFFTTIHNESDRMSGRHLFVFWLSSSWPKQYIVLRYSC
jgi:hypothetical protein